LASLGFAPRTPLHALSLAASPARSDRVARSRRSLALWYGDGHCDRRGFAPRVPLQRRSLRAAPPRSASLARSLRSVASPRVAPRTPRQRRSPAPRFAARSAPLARSLRSLVSSGFAARTLQRRSLGASPLRSAPLARSDRVARSRRSLALWYGDGHCDRR